MKLQDRRARSTSWRRISLDSRQPLRRVGMGQRSLAGLQRPPAARTFLRGPALLGKSARRLALRRADRLRAERDLQGCRPSPADQRRAGSRPALVPRDPPDHRALAFPGLRRAAFCSPAKSKPLLQVTKDCSAQPGSNLHFVHTVWPDVVGGPPARRAADRAGRGASPSSWPEQRIRCCRFSDRF